VISSVAGYGLAVARGHRLLFENLAFAVPAGEALALTGPNGAGKTSLLRAIAGFITPAQGRIDFKDQGGRLDPEDVRRSDVHFLGHQDALKSARLARDELIFQSRWTGGAEAAALAAADRLGLTRVLGLAVRNLSAGQRRRLALARLLASPRAVWLLDEPMAPLDARHRAELGAAMAEHLAAGGLIVAAAHDPLPVGARLLELGG
jgi:heme exporter protein A